MLNTMWFNFFLFGIPLIILLIGLLLLKKNKDNIYIYLLKIISFFAIITFVYSLILGLIIKVSMLGLYFKGREEYPSLILSRIFSDIILFFVLPLNVLYVLFLIIRYLKYR